MSEKQVAKSDVDIVQELVENPPQFFKADLPDNPLLTMKEIRTQAILRGEKLPWTDPNNELL